MRTAAVLAVAMLALGAMLWAADDAVIAPQPGATAAPVSQKTASVTGAITIPQMMSYQGRLTDASGVPVSDGICSVTFRLYAEPTGGSPFWTETQSVSTRDGLFSVLLGSTTPINSMPAAGAAYLGMAVAGDDEMTPRIRIVGTVCTYPPARTANLNPGEDSPFGPGDSCWVRSATPDSVLYTYHRLGLTKGNAGNKLLGVYRYTCVNFGSFCTTGMNGQSYGNIAIGGGYGNTAAQNYATIPGGYMNSAKGIYSTVGGGRNDTASGQSATVGGGYINRAGGDYATVAGGNLNRASSGYATVAGGYSNRASGGYAAVGGGASDTASGQSATVAGGNLNRAAGQYATVAGGSTNRASGIYTAVGGGSLNSASNNYATVPGGYANAASGLYATAGGRADTARALSATVSGGYINRAGGEYSTVGGGHANIADSSASTIGGGVLNLADGPWAAVAGGAINEAADTGAVIGGGAANISTGNYSTVGGGGINEASAYGSMVGGGEDNAANANYSTVGGGESDTASGNWATVGGGRENSATGVYATVPGGYGNIADGNYSFAAGEGSEVPSGYSGSVAFNGGVVDDDQEVRCDLLSANSLAFELDDPLDPAGTIMNQFAVGSPEIVVSFRGSAVIGTDGRVVAELPRYFDALCRNPTVQLTGVGSSDVYVAADVSGNSFSIGGRPGTKVYWQVTGERKDQLAEITRARVPVEERRTGALVGRSISDASLAGSLPELRRLGLDGRYSFRTAAGKQRYEDMLKKVGGQPEHRLPGSKRYQELLKKLQEPTPAPQEP